MRRWLLNAALVPRASDPCRTPGRVLVLLNLIDRDPAGVLLRCPDHISARRRGRRQRSDGNDDVVWRAPGDGSGHRCWRFSLLRGLLEQRRQPPQAVAAGPAG